MNQNSNFDPYEVINHTNEIERIQMEKEKNDRYVSRNIPEQLNKLSIMEVIDSSRMNESIPQNQSYRYSDDDYETGEPMTFKPRNVKTLSENDNENDINTNVDIDTKASFSHYSTNECCVIIRAFKENLLEMCDKVINYYENIKKRDIGSLSGSNYRVEMATFAYEALENFNLWKEEIAKVFEKGETSLIDLKERYEIKKEKDEKLKEMENSILQVTKAINENNFGISSSAKNSNSLLKYKELNSNYSNNNITNNSERLVNKLNEIEELEKIYNGKITNYEIEIRKLNEHIKYYQNVVNQSKSLIDDLYDKNKIITAKLIKYKQIAENNNNFSNTNASTFYGN